MDVDDENEGMLFSPPPRSSTEGFVDLPHSMMTPTSDIEARSLYSFQEENDYLRQNLSSRVSENEQLSNDFNKLKSSFLESQYSLEKLRSDHSLNISAFQKVEEVLHATKVISIQVLFNAIIIHKM
jgi:hypothetical protein